MRIKFTKEAKEQYEYWKQKDLKFLKKINELIKDIQRTPYEGLGKPEPLRYSLTGCWSRRINHEHRLVYRIEDDSVIVLQCRHHY
jgi:toxin YoeB